MFSPHISTYNQISTSEFLLSPLKHTCNSLMEKIRMYETILRGFPNIFVDKLLKACMQYKFCQLSFLNKKRPNNV